MDVYTAKQVRTFLSQDTRDWVRLSDYLALKSALREALDGWEEWSGSGEDVDRIEFLRAQFLDDK